MPGDSMPGDSMPGDSMPGDSMRQGCSARCQRLFRLELVFSVFPHLVSRVEAATKGLQECAVLRFVCLLILITAD